MIHAASVSWIHLDSLCLQSSAGFKVESTYNSHLKVLEVPDLRCTTSEFLKFESRNLDSF